MHKFCIHLESKNWSAGSEFSGVLYLEVDSECFPCKDWTDFSLIVAPQWLTAMRCFVNGSHAESMAFMDGRPLFFKLRREGGQSLLEVHEWRAVGDHVTHAFEITTQQIEELIIELSLKLDNARRAFECQRGNT
ncbi:MAG TPA: hypothetical protein VK157_02375 [Phycisphaerales bacterium]|nr:hypothetical protein [Phycisphaerales bacterium]